MPVLTLELAAPLQAWGDSSRFTERRTRRLPTKSGVIGLIAAALGRSRNEAVDDLAALAFGARADQPGHIVEDFQTEIDWFYAAKVGNPQKASRPLTHRHYLVDAVFLVALEGPREKLEEIRQALTHPVYPLFLGRRSCPPARRIPGEIIDDTLDNVLLNHPSVAKPRAQRTADTPPPTGALYSRDARPGETIDEICNDVPVSFADLNRQFTTRGVIHRVTPKPQAPGDPNTADAHDPFTLFTASTIPSDDESTDIDFFDAIMSDAAGNDAGTAARPEDTP